MRWRSLSQKPSSFGNVKLCFLQVGSPTRRSGLVTSCFKVLKYSSRRIPISCASSSLRCQSARVLGPAGRCLACGSCWGCCWVTGQFSASGRSGPMNPDSPSRGGAAGGGGLSARAADELRPSSMPIPNIASSGVTGGGAPVAMSLPVASRLARFRPVTSAAVPPTTCSMGCPEPRREPADKPTPALKTPAPTAVGAAASPAPATKPPAPARMAVFAWVITFVTKA